MSPGIPCRRYRDRRLIPSQLTRAQAAIAEQGLAPAPAHRGGPRHRLRRPNPILPGALPVGVASPSAPVMPPLVGLSFLEVRWPGGCDLQVLVPTPPK